ncbi:Cytochrome c-type biogenesis protein CcmE [wastewater metagenome]|uniref:Cytochrome c-type biogenesis protein CcmE n=2 Tax=unclassified sequences TaxID=12908 RepID=A0A5B8R678_9ZZZZ|nr:MULTISPECIES: cytochrome c maturation protein CcmE [Arhodomonas]MCS4504230.1 cytochrome c maturation protein CcmE [Arhodomonas aquaeolei]QEA04150.1 cytochrome c-type biogenesis protein CcmE [uncultured organism]
MKPARRNRLILVLLLVGGVGVAVALMLSAFRENMLYFYPPSQVVSGEAPTGYPFRMGGMVADGSVRHGEGVNVHFQVTDGGASVPVRYEGVLPDLFGEGQGVVVRGRLSADGTFTAEEVLAKHDENYMPPEVADAMKDGKAAQTVSEGGE